MHKKTFALDSGTCLSGDSLRVQVFPVRIEGEKVLLYLPPRDVLDRQLGSTSGCHSQAACSVQAAVYEST